MKLKRVVIDDQFGDSVDGDDVPAISCTVDWYKDRKKPTCTWQKEDPRGVLAHATPPPESECVYSA